MISIIIPVYNVEKYINKCIESVIAQTFTEYEVILIDDGSTDDSGNVCKIWEEKDSRIRFVQKDNEGLGITRNLGVELAKYDYITFLDSDDWWDMRYLESMMRPILEKCVDIVCCDIHYWEVQENGLISDTISELRINPNEVIYVANNEGLINTARTFMWGKIYKKRLFVDNRISQPAHAYEDVPTTPLLIAKSETVYRVPQPLYYYYRKRINSLANRNDTLLDMKKSIEELINNFMIENLYGVYYEQLKKLIYSQVRFVIRKAMELKSDNMEIINIYVELLKERYPEIINIHDRIYIFGSEVLSNVASLIAFDEKQIEQVCNSNMYDKVLEQGILIVDLDDMSVELVSGFVQLIDDFSKIKKVILLEQDTNNMQYKKMVEEILDRVSDRIICIKCEKNVLLNDKNSIWDLADTIFYSL